MTRSVAILGGGVGGLSAAHELIERGYTVHVYEAKGVFGGKAASQPIAGTGTGGRADLPGEHGFRFYPAFYTHLTDTMARIRPDPQRPDHTVLDRLVASDEAGIAASDGDPIHIFSRRPMSAPDDIVGTLAEAFSTIDADEGDLARFAWQVLVYLTASPERRRGEYTQISWWDFLEAHEFTPSFQGYVRAIPRTMVAMDPERGAAKTIGDISMQLLLDFGERGAQNDRTMDGPTSERWIDPWVERLAAMGVVFHPKSPVTGLVMDGDRVGHATLASGARVDADWFIAALPLEVMHRLTSDEVARAEPALARFRTVDPAWMTAWMVGAQYWLRDDRPIVKGHMFFPDSEWALTAISQAQFWERSGPPYAQRYGDGSIHGVLSVDISDWTTPSRTTGLAACETPDRDAVLDEIWRQLKVGLNGLGAMTIRDEDVVARHLDHGIVFPGGGAPPINQTPLLVHPPGSHAFRPPAATAIENLLIASDYVATDTDLASMEGANEAARRAVNALLDRDGNEAAERCMLQPLREPRIFDAAKRIDAELYRRGLPHYLDKLDDLGEIGAGLPERILRRLRPKRGLGWARAAQERLRALGDD
jgi:uncharacterized protein with NAD-binding domain and iron-sulfur cluster